jgi:small subunit ribosomal protein S1
MTKILAQTITDNKLNKLINDHMNNLPKIDELVKGRVLFVDKYEILVDIDTFTTGVVRGREIKNLPEEYQKLKIGDEIQAMVLDLENEKGQMELSLKGALIEGAWQFVREKEKTQEIIEVKIRGANYGGLLGNIHGSTAFPTVSLLNQDHYERVDRGDKNKILKKLTIFW